LPEALHQNISGTDQGPQLNLPGFVFNLITALDFTAPNVVMIIKLSMFIAIRMLMKIFFPKRLKGASWLFKL
jgi:hypothetical protein